MQRETASAEAAPAEEARPVAAPQGSALPLRVLALQRTAGNRATGRALARAAVRALHRAPLDAVPAAQRTRLREVTDALATINVIAIHSPPGATGTRVGGTTNPAPVFGTGIAAGLQPVLTSVLAHLLGGALPANSTSAVLLDLTPYGGSSRVFRFTHVVSGEPAQTSYSFPGNLQSTFDRMSAAATAADTAYTGARSLSGHDFEHGDTHATATATDFTRAVAADGGVTPTAYAESTSGEDHHLRETYAEAFLMFITEPRTLRALRPRIYAYFAALGSGRRGR